MRILHTIDTVGSREKLGNSDGAADSDGFTLEVGNRVGDTDGPVLGASELGERVGIVDTVGKADMDGVELGLVEELGI